MTTTLTIDHGMPHRSEIRNNARFVAFATLCNKEPITMLMHEELARERIRDMLQSASTQREARHSRNARLSTRVAYWAQRRAHRFDS
ncbi:hypothetical protein SAXI111661_21530 [Saccharomonospora xinjiangensis]|uniref:hypothetical protein n=1 Tax=Saccharomonospora xinjiangensis TaxID=75294 RepID=UPI0010704FC1|nr:hypothetical protein [Saccharomonospora xinjiangensis]QBQ59204.1 hypothetical protein EYD13_04145 [Saccharomonospora xinjiangensis]